MDLVLNDVEVRVLGSIVEKEITTPEYYPLSLNSVVTACNQKSNRDPAVSYDEQTVDQALSSLTEKGLVLVVRARDSRVTKYDNYFADFYKLDPKEAAAMCVMMLRGPQTVGEIKIRGERLYQFSSLEEVEEALGQLASREDGALVVRLPRQPGQKESRYAHLLSGEVDVASMGATVGGESDDRIGQLEEQVAALQQELRDLNDQFAEFRRQFE